MITRHKLVLRCIKLQTQVDQCTGAQGCALSALFALEDEHETDTSSIALRVVQNCLRSDGT